MNSSTGSAAPAESQQPLSSEELRKINAYWRAANYLSVGQIYLFANPLLREPLKLEHIKPRLLGHWGTTPGLNFIYVHFNRLIKKDDLERHLHRRPGTRRAGSRCQHLSRRHLQRDLPPHPAERRGHAEIVQAVFLSGRNSQPRCAGNSGFDSRRRRTWVLDCSCVRRGIRQSRSAGLLRGGRRRSRNRSAGGSWHSNKFLNPARDGAVLPILHLNGYKIANPTVLGRMDDADSHPAFHWLRIQTLFRRRP